MRRLLMQRVLLGLLTLWLGSGLIFVGTEMLPGDVASAILGQSATPETVAALRASLGLDQPALQRYLMWLLHFLQGDLGTSLTNGRSIAADLMPRLYNTLFLASYAALVVIPLSILLGIASAIWQNSLFDRAASVLSLASISMPEFFVGYVLIILLAVKWALLPSLAGVSDSMSWSERLYATTLPMLTLLFVVTAPILRTTPASVIAVMGSAYIEMAIVKGLPKWRIVVQHALPNALAPIINAVSFNLAYLVVGVIMVEVVFVYPGVGQLMVDGVWKRDLPVVQACGLLFAAAYIGLNTLADVLAVWVNPRLRQARLVPYENIWQNRGRQRCHRRPDCRGAGGPGLAGAAGGTAWRDRNRWRYLAAAGRRASAWHRQHRARHAFAAVIRRTHYAWHRACDQFALLLPGHRQRLCRRGARTLRRSAALASGRYVDGDSGADLRADDSLGARHLGAGVDLHHRRAGRHAGVPAGAAGGARHHGARVSGSGAGAGGRVGVDYPARDFAQRGAGLAGGIRHALWLHHPVRRRPELSRPGHSAAVCRLGRHGA